VRDLTDVADGGRTVALRRSLDRRRGAREDGRMSDPVHETLRDLPLFEALDEATLRRLAAGSRLVRARRGEALVQEGRSCDSFFAVRKGAVRVYRVAADGRTQVLHRLGPGQTFAEAAVLTMGTYPANAEATRDGTEVVEIGAATFLRLFDEDPRLPRTMVASLSGWLRRLLARVEELSVASAGARLARYLLDLPARDVGGGLEVRLPVSKREVAERLAITPETLSRQLRRWHDAGVVTSERSRLVLLQPETLLAIATDG